MEEEFGVVIYVQRVDYKSAVPKPMTDRQSRDSEIGLNLLFGEFGWLLLFARLFLGKMELR